MPFGLAWGQVAKLVPLIPRWVSFLKSGAPLIRDTLDVIDAREDGGAEPQALPPSTQGEVIAALDHQMRDYHEIEKQREERDGG